MAVYTKFRALVCGSSLFLCMFLIPSLAHAGCADLSIEGIGSIDTTSQGFVHDVDVATSILKKDTGLNSLQAEAFHSIVLEIAKAIKASNEANGDEAKKKLQSGMQVACKELSQNKNREAALAEALNKSGLTLPAPAAASSSCDSLTVSSDAVKTFFADLDKGSAKEKEVAIASLNGSLSQEIGNRHLNGLVTENLQKIARELVRVLAMEKNRPNGEKNLSAGLIAACKQLNAESNNGYDASRKAAFAAADMREPTGLAISDTEGGDSTYVFMFGNVNSLQANGGWNSNAEYAFSSVTKWSEGKNEKGIYSYFDANYAKLGALEKSNGSPMPGNPFSQDTGVFRLNGSMAYRFSYASWVVGIGGTSISATNQTHTALKTRVFSGVRFNANFGTAKNGSASRGFVLFALANDKIWEWQDEQGGNMKSHGRIVLDAQLDAPALSKGDSIRVGVRLFADTPSNGDGPSDLRISILVSMDLGPLFSR